MVFNGNYWKLVFLIWYGLGLILVLTNPSQNGTYMDKS